MIRKSVPSLREVAVPVLYLDIDGTVRLGADERGGKFVNGPEDVEIFPEVPDLLRRYRALGWRIVGVSNQGGIALGHTSMAMVVEAMVRTDDLCGRAFDKIAWCPHHPAAVQRGGLELAQCWCRKPFPGLAIEAVTVLGEEIARDPLRRSERYPPHLALFVGDREEDRGCAAALNVRFMEARDWRSGAHIIEVEG